MSKRIDLPRDELFQYYVVEDHTREETAAYFNVKLKTIECNLNRYKIRKTKEKLDWDAKKDEIIAIYQEQRMSISQLARLYNVHPVTMNEHLTKWGVKRQILSLEEQYDIDQMVELHINQKVSLAETARICKVSINKVRECLASRDLYKKNEKLARSFPVEERLIRFMRSLSREIPIEFYRQFDDFDRMRLLHRIVNNSRGSGNRSYRWSDEEYKQIMITLYDQPPYSQYFYHYIATGNDWDKPSLDHIDPVSKNKESSWSKDNVHIMSVFENQCKSDLDWKEYLEAVEYYYGDEARQITENRYNLNEDKVKIHDTSSEEDSGGAFLLLGSKERIARNKEILAEIIANYTENTGGMNQ